MYRKEKPSTDGPEKFELPFEGQLSPENRWIAMANEIPWSEFEDEKVRSSIEGKFGVGKRKYSLDRVMTKLSQTSETAMAITFLVMNLSTLLKRAFSLFLRFFYLKTVFARVFISNTYFLVYNDNKKLSAVFFE